MTLQIADYILLALALVLAIRGAFRGFSGTVAFLGATLAAVLTARFLWPSIGMMNMPHWIWVKFVIVVTVTVVIFGIVRVLVAKVVRFLLAEPMDAILGVVSGLVVAAMMIYAWAYLGNRIHDDCPRFRDCSSIVRAVSSHVG